MWCAISSGVSLSLSLSFSLIYNTKVKTFVNLIYSGLFCNVIDEL